jgi:hypothetical protein
VPITFNVYNVGTDNAVGSIIASVTQTFAIPYRPSADATHCSATPTEWYNGTSCFNGKAVDVTFTFPTHPTVGTSAIFGITFNTDDYGYSPLHGSGSPTDSLNIATYPGTGGGLVAVAPSVGTWLPDGLSVYASTGSPATTFAGPTTSVSSDMNDFGGYEPAVQFTAN